MTDHPSHTVSNALIDYRLQIAERLNGNRDKILNRAGVRFVEINDLSGGISLEKERRLWRAMKEETAREDIGLQCGLHFPVHSMGMIGYVMMNASSMKKAMEHFCRFQKMVGDSMGMRLEEKHHYTTCHIDLWSPWHDELRYTTDLFIAATLSWIRTNSSSQPSPLRVGFHFRRPANMEDYIKVFHPAQVEFSCDTSFLIYESTDLDAPIISSNRELFGYFYNQLETLYDEYEGKNTVRWKVKQLILEQMLGEPPEVEKIASQLLMSVRSLQKTLKAENTSFRELLQEVRKEVACDHLEKGELLVSEIAYLLGFSDVAVFSRNFKKWTGVSATDWKSLGKDSS